MAIVNRLIVFVLVLALSSCADHRLPDPAAPLRLRLKQVAGTTPNGSPINSTYTYDSLNRLRRIERIDGSLSLILYNSPDERYAFYIDYSNPTDRRGGKITLYPPNFRQTPQRELIGLQYFFKSDPQVIDPYSPVAYLHISLITHFEDFGYAFNANNQLIQYNEYLPPNRVKMEQVDYKYTNENITAATRTSFNTYGPPTSQTNSLLEYDDKPNPYFGLLDTAIDPALRFSANNVIKNTLISGSATPAVSTYRYEYNQQGFPTKSILERDGKTYTTTYTYESY